MSMIKLTPASSKEFLEANKDVLVILIFDAEFSGQQDIVDDAVRALADNLQGRAVIAHVDVETNNDLATQFTVVSVPMIVCVKKGLAVKKIDTFEPNKLVNIVREQLKLFEITETDESCQHADPKKAFKTYLKKLTTRAPVMVFMKGEPTAPRCGFSKQLVELLARHNIVYETFDILQDDEVRQGLKEYSDWPTYPQIYSKGEFVGGLDILKQMEETGELESTLKV